MFAAIMPTDRIFEWGNGNAGVRGGIPASSAMTIHTTLPAGSSAATINAAIAACPSNQVVQLAAGTYNLTGKITGKSGVVLRGAGTNATTLIPNHTSYGGAFHIGDSYIYQGQNGNYNGGNSVNWTAGYTQGTTNITLASTTGLTVGNILILDQLNDTNFVNPVGYEGDNGAGRGGSDRAIQQFVEVRAIVGNVVTIDPPLQGSFWNSGLDPEAWWIGTSGSFWIKRFGIEEMTIDGEDLNGFDPYAANIYYETAAECWIKNVVSLRSKIAHVNWFGYYRCEVRNSMFWGTQSGLSLSYGLLTVNGSWTLVEDNTFERIVVPVMAGTCSSLGVVGYNYSRFHYYAGANNWQMPFFAAHDAHNYGFLLEGNHSARVVFDFIHGSSSHHLMFRNVFHGQDDESYPSGPAVNNLQIVELQLTNRWISSVGNILGTNGLYANQYDVPGARLSDPVIYDIGIVNGGYPVASNWWADTNAFTTFFAHMDYDFAVDAITYNATNADVALPVSMYYTSKPSFFGGMTWPPYNPTNVTATQRHYTNIPAGLRFSGGTVPADGPDVTPPTITASTINSAGATITMTTDEAVSVGAGGTGGFTLSATGGAVTMTHSSGTTYTLSRTVYNTETVTISYTQPGNGFEDLAGNDLATFSGAAVTGGASPPAGGNRVSTGILRVGTIKVAP